MTGPSDPIVIFLVVLLIGIVAGFLAQRFFRSSWISQQISGRNRGTVTSMLVGIAGSFIGFHLGDLSNLARSGSLVPFVAAAVVAVLVLWGWKAIRI
jgi:uncharacterized membrane protein YeaQ/YmgE (transglycosylase-associated protein family)